MTLENMASVYQHHTQVGDASRFSYWNIHPKKHILSLRDLWVVWFTQGWPYLVSDTCDTGKQEVDIVNSILTMCERMNSMLCSETSMHLKTKPIDSDWLTGWLFLIIIHNYSIAYIFYLTHLFISSSFSEILNISFGSLSLFLSIIFDINDSCLLPAHVFCLAYLYTFHTVLTELHTRLATVLKRLIFLDLVKSNKSQMCHWQRTMYQAIVLLCMSLCYI